jgi:hypothetical protein
MGEFAGAAKPQFGLRASLGFTTGPRGRGWRCCPRCPLASTHSRSTRASCSPSCSRARHGTAGRLRGRPSLYLRPKSAGISPQSLVFQCRIADLRWMLAQPGFCSGDQGARSNRKGVLNVLWILTCRRRPTGSPEQSPRRSGRRRRSSQGPLNPSARWPGTLRYCWFPNRRSAEIQFDRSPDRPLGTRSRLGFLCMMRRR